MKQILIFGILSFLISACETNPKVHTSETNPSDADRDQVAINDYPTRERVDYVLECVAKHGGLTYITQYACGCKIDKIAEKISFADYDAARTFTQMQKTPGEAGAVFRDPKQSKDLRATLKEVDAEAEKACFVQ